jgi:hypothetical protein
MAMKQDHERLLDALESAQLNSGCGDDLDTLLYLIDHLEMDFLGHTMADELKEMARDRHQP